MKHSAILLFVGLSVVLAADDLTLPQLDGRIIGGEDARVESYPYQVSLRMQGSHICGGSILDEQTILTAAHCVSNYMLPRVYTVQYGISIAGGSANTIPVRHLVKHQNYSSYNMDYDVALIFLSSNITFSNSAKPIELASQTPEVGSDAVVTGWGTLAEGASSIATVLQAVTVSTVSDEECNDKYDRYASITPRMLCAGVSGGGKDACQGDSGGPLAVGQKLVGIVSWGLGCGRPEFPGVYTNVAAVADWIRQNWQENRI